jgi:signal transduction histidine kinase
MYFMAASSSIIDGRQIHFLFYTDVTSIFDFKSSMNRTLGLILVIFGAFSLILPIVMSVRLKDSIKKLSRYAMEIGRGSFDSTINKLDYSEFEHLSNNKTKMAHLLQSSEEKQKHFFQNASHELRTPLMSIQGYAESIIENVFSKDEAAEIIIAESTKMDALVSGMLYISRIDSGLETSKTLSPVDINDLLAYCHERLKVIAEKASKRILIEYTKTSVVFETDYKKLVIVVTNVLSNAIRYADSEISVKYSIAGGRLEIQIYNDGQGINLNDLPYIFDRFYKGEEGNSGLGLAISKDLLSSLQGSIKAENISPSGQGVLFTIRLG